MLGLRYDTLPAWLDAVRGDLDGFLQDHAANERKAAGSALTLAAQYPDRAPLASAMIDLAREELEHFKLVHDALARRGRTLGYDTPSPYMRPLRKLVRKRDTDEYLLDRLLVFAVAEARGCERFGILAEGIGDGIDDGHLRALYQDLTRAEARHHGLFVRLAGEYFDPGIVTARLDAFLDAEAGIVRGLPVRAALY